MITIHIRKQGGAAIITIPSNILKMLNLKIGAPVELEVKKGVLKIHAARKSLRKRYSLKELLQGVKKKDMKKINQETAWAREGKPVGREIA